MTRENWTIIRDTLSDDIRSGRLSAGDQLPTETQLADRFEIGRHSVRRALEALARDGKISIEQGRGTFVADTPRLTYQIGKRTRLRRNLIPQGVDVTSQLVSATRIPAPDYVSIALLLNSGARVIESQRITLANDLPVAFGCVYHCAERFPESRLLIFNRWGDKVYENENYQNDWRGTYKDQPLPKGSYYYMMYLNDDANTILSGYLVIRR